MRLPKFLRRQKYESREISRSSGALQPGDRVEVIGYGWDGPATVVEAWGAYVTVQTLNGRRGSFWQGNIKRCGS